MYNNVRDELDAFVGSKKHYYGPKFETFLDQDSKVSWNWPTLFVPVLWMAYRKMYIQAIAYILIVDAISFGLEGARFSGLIRLAIWLGFPIFANYLYFRHATSKIKTVSETLDSVSREEEIRRLGGTSVVAVLVFLLASILTSILLFVVTGGYEILMQTINNMSQTM